jgi:transcriptional regulator with XRE-family HTH domain
MNEKLKAARNARRWSIAQISQYLEIHISSYKDWEAGRHQPVRRNLKKLCTLLKKTPQELGFEGVG